ncbi:DUF4882 family protein [Acinetobacter sp. AHP123]|uniref:DUF4882 family protein n=1 Tax=Acinetobacter sp. AHP123 TaxID=2913495 RepID=UPI00207553E1|nr:DUF4882 family protein [Acinetobacter sp. AHP123]
MKKIGIVAVSAITLCWAMYEISSDNTTTVSQNEFSQKVAPKSISSTTKNEKLASQTLLAQTTSINSSAPVCKYNFDATQEDFDVFNTQYSDRPPTMRFPLINGQKFGFKVEPITEDKYGYLVYTAKSKTKMNSTTYEGDFLLPNKKGVVAFEMQLKVPIASSSESFYVSNIDFTGVTDNNYTIRSFYEFIIGAHDFEFGENPPSLYYSLVSEVGDYELIDRYFKNKKMTSNTNEYQRLGIYINQDTKQVGFIFNGVDEGYQFKLPGSLQKVAFAIDAHADIVSTNFFGQEFSSELITDRNALQFSYPQGTTDMCGNAI